MSYRVTIDGVEIEMDTAEEVFRLLRNSESDATVVGRAITGTVAGIWNERTLTEYLRSLPKGENFQIRAIRSLYYGQPDGLSQMDFIAQIEGIEDAQQLGGVLSGLAKNATKLGLPLACEIVTLPRDDGKRVYRYRLSPSFRAALDQLMRDTVDDTKKTE